MCCNERFVARRQLNTSKSDCGVELCGYSPTQCDHWFWWSRPPIYAVCMDICFHRNSAKVSNKHGRDVCAQLSWAGWTMETTRNGKFPKQSPHNWRANFFFIKNINKLLEVNMLMLWPDNSLEANVTQLSLSGGQNASCGYSKCEVPAILLGVFSCASCFTAPVTNSSAFVLVGCNAHGFEYSD